MSFGPIPTFSTTAHVGSAIVPCAKLCAKLVADSAQLTKEIEKAAKDAQAAALESAAKGAAAAGPLADATLASALKDAATKRDEAVKANLAVQAAKAAIDKATKQLNELPDDLIAKAEAAKRNFLSQLAAKSGQTEAILEASGDAALAQLAKTHSLGPAFGAYKAAFGAVKKAQDLVAKINVDALQLAATATAADLAHKAADAVAKAAGLSSGAAKAVKEAEAAADLAVEAARKINKLSEDAKHLTQDMAGACSNEPSTATSPTTALEKAAKDAEAEVEKTYEQAAKTFETIDGGHALDRHGPQLTDAQLTARLTTCIAPDGVFSPTDASTKFDTYEAFVESRQIAREEIMNLQKLAPNAGSLPGRFSNDAIDHPGPIDSGFQGVGAVQVTDGLSGKTGEGYTGVNAVAGLTRSIASIEWNPATERWDTSQHIPKGRGWNGAGYTP